MAGMDVTGAIGEVTKRSDAAMASLQAIQAEGNVDPGKMLQLQWDMNMFTQLLGTVSDTMNSLNSSMGKLSQNIK